MPVTWQDIFDLCRAANGPIGIVAFICLGYRAAIGLHDGLIVYRPMFVLFVAYVFVAAVGSPVNIAAGNRATVLSPILTALHVTLIAVCVANPGPLRRPDNQPKEHRHA